MTFRAALVAQDALQYFLRPDQENIFLRVSDVLVRVNLGPEIFSRFIRLSTNSQWSHAALLYLMNDPREGFDNMFVLEAMNGAGVRVVSWKGEVTPYDKFAVGIRRLQLDWYKESAYEAASHDPKDPENIDGIWYLRRVRGMALDQINAMFDEGTIGELTALYVERLAGQYKLPFLFKIAAWFVQLIRGRGQADPTPRFICSGLVQYSFFAALRQNIIDCFASDQPGDHDIALSNLDNMHHVIFRADPDGIIANYVQQVKSGELKPDTPVPGNVEDFLRTTTPADFSRSPNLQWRYVIRAGKVWEILNDALADYKPQSPDEAAVLALLS